MVSFETAKRLHTAGFPQPEARYYQAWYDENGVLSIIITEEDYQYFNGVIFAPTATDILMLLSSTRFYFDKIWRVHWFRYNTVDEFKHEDPAEACALAWLAGYREPIKMPVHTITCMTDSSLSVGNVESK